VVSFIAFCVRLAFAELSAIGAATHQQVAWKRILRFRVSSAHTLVLKTVLQKDA
jgi:hypothetical protein